MDGAPTITRIELETEGDVPSIDEGHFREHAEEAKAGCPVSRALAGVEEITFGLLRPDPSQLDLFMREIRPHLRVA